MLNCETLRGNHADKIKVVGLLKKNFDLELTIQKGSCNGERRKTFFRRKKIQE